MRHRKKMIGRDRKIFTLLAALVVALVAPQVSYAQDDRLNAEWQSDTRRSVCIDFRVNSATVERTYHDNAVMLDRIDSLFTAIKSDTLIEIVSVEFCGTASPEGNSIINSRLSHGRMVALEKVVRDHINIPDSLVLHNDHYIAWHHLVDMIEADEALPSRDKVIEILHTDYPEAKDWAGRPMDGRLPKLQALGTTVWNYLLRNYFVHMRNAWFIVVTHRNKVVEPEPEPVPEPEPEPEPVPEPEPIPEPISEPEPEPVVEEKPRVPLMSIKNNLLEDAALVINLGAEFRITKRLSFDVMGHYSPYDYFTDVRKIRVFAIQPEIRYWWGESLVKGHFIGLHAPIAGFNVQLNDKYRYQDPNHAIWGLGLSYGYAMPLGKKGNWGIEFTIGVGYMDIKYDVYEGVTNGRYLRTETRNYIGPTRLGIDISYRIDMSKKQKKNKELSE